MSVRLIAVLVISALNFAVSGGEAAEAFRLAAAPALVAADFVQVRHLKELDMQVEIRGRMLRERVGRLRWQVDSPVRSVTVIGRDKLVHFDRETRKLAVLDPAAVPGMRTLQECFTDWLSGDPERLKRNFDLARSAPDTLLLRPREAGVRELYREIELRFDSERGVLRAIRICERSGDRMEIRFENIRIDPDVPADVWRMPPE